MWPLAMLLSVSVCGCESESAHEETETEEPRRKRRKKRKRSAAPSASAASSSSVAPTQGATCETAADKLIELSLIQGKEIGRVWSKEKQAKKKDGFIKTCRDKKMSQATLDCVVASPKIETAQACLAKP